jgi:hypothetical protein
VELNRCCNAKRDKHHRRNNLRDDERWLRLRRRHGFQIWLAETGHLITLKA